MAWELYRREWGRLGGKSTTPYLSIFNGTALSMNVTAYEQLGKPDNVEVMVDRERRAIGLRAAEATGKTYRVSTMRSISCRLAIRAMGVPKGPPR